MLSLHCVYLYRRIFEKLNTKYTKMIGSVKTVEVSNQIKIHSNVVCCDRANRILGFIAQTVFLKTLYCAMVPQILEYVLTDRNPHQEYLHEEIQSSFICMMGMKNGYSTDEPIESLSRELG